ncbi:hypothetical protein J3B02_001118 [Coemansia erecta]|uniref:Uncharacterized protein n=1 Tax=Coemansia asiatica TaxID=1052880 RepID=A0A9W7XFF3_9FUNG|nr:hypothetical protein LPJ64_004864 [Coemansia asiatica]KAJ2857263.1 hypothetical protein J3B02_001118 [Coemansia erecta]KAJ2887570.1 hypothetical protein FB639_001218 [Coemansia asiatica]
MGNGAKAQMKRERNGKAASKEPSSQLKVNAAAKNIKCSVCFSDFLCTSRAKQLEEHAMNKHNKSLNDCFAGFVEPPSKKK